MINVLSLSFFPWAGRPTEGEQLITRNHQHRRHPRPTEPTPIITFPGDGEESTTTAKKKIVAAALAKCEKPASNVLL